MTPSSAKHPLAQVQRLTSVSVTLENECNSNFDLNLSPGGPCHFLCFSQERFGNIRNTPSKIFPGPGAGGGGGGRNNELRISTASQLRTHKLCTALN